MENTQSAEKTLAFVIYQGLTLFDLVGPLGVLQKFCELNPGYRTSIVAERMEPIRSDNELTVMPDATFADVPHPFAIFVPGGNTPTLKAMSNPAVRAYLRQAGEGAEFIGSVCTGALILAAIGLLDGKPATTHWAYGKILDSLGSRYVRERWVNNGKVINSAGVSAGIDMALFFVSRLAGEAAAREVQLWIDYDPRPPYQIDWERLPMMARGLMLYHAAAAPLIAAKPKSLLKAGL